MFQEDENIGNMFIRLQGITQFEALTAKDAAYEMESACLRSISFISCPSFWVKLNSTGSLKPVQINSFTYLPKAAS